MPGHPDATSPSVDRTAASRRGVGRVAHDVDGGRARERERALRRSVGPTAWAVLGDLCQDARPDDDGVVVVAASARQLAANVGIGKDTAARALRRLGAAGVLRRRPQATDDAGRFGCCTYELYLGFRAGRPRPANLDTEPDPCPVREDADDNSHPSINDPTREAAGGLAEGSRPASPRRDSRGRRPGAGSQLSLLDGCDDARIGAVP